MKLKPSHRSNGLVKSHVTGGIAIKDISIRAVPASVFAALTKPAKLNAWFTTGAKVDLRVGGRYTDRDKDTGKFLEVVPNKRLRFTWDNRDHAPGTIVEIVLTRKQEGTTVSLLHHGSSKRKGFEHYSSDVAGWNWALFDLKAYLEGRPVVQYEDWLKKR